MKLHENRNFVSILADGLFHKTVPEGTEGARIRKYKTSDGVEGEKTEMVYSEIVGKITSINFHEGNFGNQLQVTISDGDEEPIVISVPASSNFGEDMLKKLPNIDLEKIVKIQPYSFTDEKKKTKKGVTIWQHDGKKTVKLTNYFYDAEKKKNLHGYPDFPAVIQKLLKEEKKVPTAKWKLYFAEAKEFLVEFIKEKFNITDAPATTSDELDEQMDTLVSDAAKALD